MGKAIVRVCVCVGAVAVIGGAFLLVQPLLRSPQKTAMNAPAASAGDESSVSEVGTAASVAEEDAEFFIFAAPDHQGAVASHSGRLHLSVTDLTIRTGQSNLQLQRRYESRGTAQGLLGSRWRFNWEITLDRLGMIALIDDWNGPLLLTGDASGREFRAPGGERLVVGEQHCTYTRLDGSTDVFDTDGRIIRRERGGGQFSVSYDAKNRLSRIDGPHRSFLQFVLDDTGRVTRVRSSNGSSVQYDFHDAQLAKMSADHGGSVSYLYDAEGLLSQIEHPQFGAVTFQYDDQGRVLSRGWIDGTEETWAYDDKERTVRHTDPAGAVTTYRTSADHRREETVNALGHKIALVYNEAGQVSQMTGPTGQTVTNTYDEHGRIVRIERSFRTSRLEYLLNSSVRLA